MTNLNWQPLLEAVATDCGVDPYTVAYLSTRLKNEGVRFLTVTLPKLGKALLRSVELRSFERPTDFAWKGRSLRYFRSLLDLIFCRKTGDLLPDYCVISFNYLRQLCEYCYKLGLAFTEEQLVAAETKYVATNELSRFNPANHTWFEKLRVTAERYYPRLFSGHAHEILSHGPRYGPGSFVGSGAISRKTGRSFSAWKLLPDALTGTCNTTQVAFSGFFKPYPSSPTRVVTVSEDRTCEVLFVKKDSRGPRVISKEPVHILRAQLAFFSWFTKILERDSSYRINFVDQGINQSLAKSSSLDGRHATLDLKDASDRVSIYLAKHVFRHAPGIYHYLCNWRSTHSRLPSGTTVKLNAVAGMGSGLTFPLLAFFTHLSVCVAICNRTGLNFENVRKLVYVYGDDLIVPTEYVSDALIGLEKSGLAVNLEKSFVKGPFRESCGGDFIQGNECAPVRLKLQSCELPEPTSCRDGLKVLRSDASLIKALVAHSHELHRSGLPLTAAYIERVLTQVIPMPFVGYRSPVLGRYTWDSSQVYRQASGHSTACPDGYLFRVATSAPVLEDCKDRCPYKFLGRKVRSNDFIQPWIDIQGGAVPYEVSPIPRKIRLKFGKVPVIAATEVVAY